jgi:hypothetical protein
LAKHTAPVCPFPASPADGESASGFILPESEEEKAIFMSDASYEEYVAA